MIIILAPCAGTKTTTVSINGTMLTIDGTDYDLSVIPEGGQAEAVEGSPFIGTLTRDKVVVRYEYDMEKAEDYQSTSWDDWTFFVEAGEVPCPIRWKPEPEVVEQEAAQ